MELIDSFLLGLLQGLTEFLPISSSGHLVLGKTLLSDTLEKSITFEVVVHFGTLCSILVYYREKLTAIVVSLLGLINPAEGYTEKIRKDDNVKLTGFIILSMIPAVVVGLALEDQIESLFMNPFMVSVMLLVTGALLYVTKLRVNHTEKVGLWSSMYIGIAQAFAIIPGISRSGSTISMGLYLGIEREKVANFSFLMVIPVIAGAMLLQIMEMAEKGLEAEAILSLLTGFVTAFISGYLALKYLIIILKTRGIYPFAWYCWALGGLGIYYFW